jgi:F0F1-type ATP synthase gamma subunit
MSELLQIKKRINSIHKINKITNVMEIISISKTAKLKQLFLNNIDFQNNLYKCIAALKINDTNSSQVKL